MKHNANHYGEKYRSSGFIPDKYGNSVGCYNTFEVHPDFKQLHPSSKMFEKIALILTFYNKKSFLKNTSKSELLNDYESFESVKLYNSIFYNQKLDLYMGYYWDGDGSLLFIDKKKRKFLNTDCKKDYVWDIL